MSFKDHTILAFCGGVSAAIYHLPDTFYFNYTIKQKKPNIPLKGLGYSMMVNAFKFCGSFALGMCIDKQMSRMNLPFQIWGVQKNISFAISTGIMSCVANPFEAIRVPLLTTSGNVRSIAKDIYTTRGLSGFARGYGFSVLQWVSAGCAYGIYSNNDLVSSVFAMILLVGVSFPLDICSVLRRDLTTNYGVRECIKQSIFVVTTGQNLQTLGMFLMRYALAVPVWGFCLFCAKHLE